MKKIQFIILLCTVVFFSFSPFENGQNEEWNGSVTYKVRSKMTQEELEEKLKSLKEEEKIHEDLMRKIFQDMLDLEFELIFNRKKSLFKHKAALSIQEDDLAKNMALITISGGASYYRDLEKERKIKQQEYLGQITNVIEQLDSYDWKILDETKIIGKYECKKAISIVKEISFNGEKEREIIAWFTTEIPVFFGPLGIEGLPGLILEVSIKNDRFLYASEIEIGKDVVKDKDIALPKGGNEISEKEWDEFHKKENARIRQRNN